MQLSVLFDTSHPSRLLSCLFLSPSAEMPPVCAMLLCPGSLFNPGSRCFILSRIKIRCAALRWRPFHARWEQYIGHHADIDWKYRSPAPICPWFFITQNLNGLSVLISKGIKGFKFRHQSPECLDVWPQQKPVCDKSPEFSTESCTLLFAERWQIKPKMRRLDNEQIRLLAPFKIRLERDKLKISCRRLK